MRRGRPGHGRAPAPRRGRRRRYRSVGLDVAAGRRDGTGRRERRSDQRLLGIGVRHQMPTVRRPRSRPRADDGDAIAVSGGSAAASGRRTTQPAALAAREAARVAVERPAPTVAGEQAGAAERDPDLGRQQDADTAGERDSRSPTARLRQARWTALRADEQAVSTARLGPRRSRRYEMRLAATLGQARRRVAVDRASPPGPYCDQRSPARDAGEHAGRRPARASRAAAGVLERLPGHLEQQTLLRIEPRASRGEIPKKSASQADGQVDERAVPRRDPPRDGRVRVVERVDVEAVGGDLAVRRPAPR